MFNMEELNFFKISIWVRYLLCMINTYKLSVKFTQFSNVYKGKIIHNKYRLGVDDNV